MKSTKLESTKKTNKKWLFFLALIFLLVFAEAGLRIFTSYDSRLNIRIGGLKKFDQKLSFRLKENYRATGISINSKGILGPEFTSEKGENTIRIMVLGDSCSFTPTEGNYPSVVNEELPNLIPDRNIEVINASVPGYSSIQANLWYHSDLINYQHDILIIYLGWNDMGQYYPEGFLYKKIGQGYVNKPSSMQKIISNIYLFRIVYVLQFFLRKYQPVVDVPLSERDTALYDSFYPTHYEKNVSQIVNTAKKNGVRVVLLNFATFINDDMKKDELKRLHFPKGMDKNVDKYRMLQKIYFRALEKVARENDVPIWDIASLFDTNEKRAFFTDTMHFNVHGAQLIGNYIANRLAQEFQLNGFVKNPS